MRMTVSGIEFSYDSVSRISDIGFDAEGGDVVSILGPNGVGKTTLLKCINMVHRPHGGSVMVDEHSIPEMPSRDIAKVIGYVPQRAHVSGSTVFESVLIGRKPHIAVDATEKDLRLVGRIIDLLDLTGIADKPVNQISGGEYQMVQIARALAQQPRVLLLDEPTSNLDLKNQYHVLDAISNVVRANGMCAVMTNHDLNLALRFSTKFILMRQGRVFAAGRKEIITEENIRDVYGIEVSVGDVDGNTVVVPKRCIF